MARAKPTRTWCPSPLRNSLKGDTSSDENVATMKALEITKRQERAIAFINELTGVGIDLDSSEAQFRDKLKDGVILLQMLNKIRVKAHQDEIRVVKVGAAVSRKSHAAFQAKENISNYLTAIKALHPELKCFEASDFEDEGSGTSRTHQIVDSILDLELWYAGQQQGEVMSPNSWRRQNPTLPDLTPLPAKIQHAAAVEDASSYCSPSNNSGHARSLEDITGLARLVLSSPMAAPSPRTPFAPQLQPIPGTPSSPMAEIVGTVLGSTKVADINGIAHRLELFVETCKQEFDNLKYVKDEQMLKLKEALMDALKSDELHQSRGRMLEALMEGQTEEVQVVSEQLQQAQEEHAKVTREKRRLKEELVRTRHDLESARQRTKELEAEETGKEAAYREEAAKKRQQLLGAAEELQALKGALVDTKMEMHRAGEGWKEYLKSLEGQMGELLQVTQGYQKVLEENRKLYNEVQDLKGNIRVYCRVRPLHSHESDRPSCVEFLNSNGDIMVGSSVKPNTRRGFTFDKVFGPATSQEAIFADTRPLIRSVLDGYNVCIFAYGQTGSGKTFTMAGPNNPSEQDWGVNVRALNDLFGLGRDRARTMKYQVGVQMVEIYNEQVRDLLDGSGAGPRSLEIRNNSQVDGLNVPDATKVPVDSTAAVLRLMDLGMRNRAVACTSLNERSSRSHSVLTVHVYGQDVLSGSILRGCLHLVDLAGSERVDRSEATGDRLKEAQHINKSLSALGDVIAALANKSPHIPYRNSKLTQLLQDALGKQAKTLMFVHVSPDEESYGETVSTLTFAKRVASVELGASSKNSESAELRESREKIANLKDELQRKAAEVERLQQAKAEAMTRASALAAAAAAAVPARAPDRRLGDTGTLAKRALSPEKVPARTPDRRLSDAGGLAKRALSPEKEPEKNARVKRLGEGMNAIAEESEAAAEGRASIGRLTRSRGLPPTIPGVRKTLTRKKSVSKNQEVPTSAVILTRAAAAAAERASGAFSHSEVSTGVFSHSGLSAGTESGAQAKTTENEGVQTLVASTSDLSAYGESESGETLASNESDSDTCHNTEDPVVVQKEVPSEQSELGEKPAPKVLSVATSFRPGTTPLAEMHLRRAVSLNVAPVSDPPLVSPATTPRAKDPLRVSSEDFNVPQQPTRPDSRLKKLVEKTGAEKENVDVGEAPLLFPVVFEKQSVASKVRLGSTSGDSASKLPTPRRLTLAGTLLPTVPGRPGNHRRSSSVEDVLPVQVSASAIPAPPSRLKPPGAALAASGSALKQASRRQWV